MQTAIDFPSLERDAEMKPADDTLLQPPTRKESAPPVNAYGYEEATPDERNTYGYEDASPDSPGKYGYEDAAPTNATVHKKHQYDGTRTPRRSSLASTSSRQHRRASIGTGATTMVEVRVRGERFPVQRRRSIDFSATVQVKEVQPMTAMADNEELWLQQEDFAKMKSDRRAVVNKHKKGTAEPSNPDEDIRGLEKYIDRNVRLAKNKAWDTVLIEQDEQEMAGDFNEQRIADLYKSSTYQSPAKAQARAQQDEQEVRDYLLSPKTKRLMMRRLSC